MEYTFPILVLVAIEVIVFFLICSQRRKREASQAAQEQASQVAQEHIFYPFLEDEIVDRVREVLAKQPHETLIFDGNAVPISEGKYRAMGIQLVESCCKNDPKLIMCVSGPYHYVPWGLLWRSEMNAVMEAAMGQIEQLEKEQ